MPDYSWSPYLQQQQFGGGYGGAAGTAASIPASLMGLSPTAGIGQLVGQQLGGIGDLINGGNNAQGSAEGFGINSGLGLASLIPGPQQIPLAALSAIAPFIESFIPNGVPREAKTASIGQALSGSPNQLQDIIGQLINHGVNQGQVLSQGGSNTLGGAAERTAAMLEALTGQQIGSVTGSGNFQNDPTLSFRKMFKAVGSNPLPAGYSFVSDPAGINTAATDIQKMVGTQAPVGRAGQSQEWQNLMQQLIQQHVLQKYQGPMGAPGAGTLGTGGIPNVGLPHPFNQQQTAATGPYPT